MDDFFSYLKEPSAMDELAAGRLRRILNRYPWFSTAELLLARAQRRADPVTLLRFTGRPIPSVLLDDVTEAHFDEGRTLEVIDDFLSRPVGPIRPDGRDAGERAAVAEPVDADPDLVSEELAEIYLAQGQKKRAREIYVKLSLLVPEKSVYFAELIERIDCPEADEGNFENN